MFPNTANKIPNIFFQKRRWGGEGGEKVNYSLEALVKYLFKMFAPILILLHRKNP